MSKFSNPGFELITFEDMFDCFKIQILKQKGENWAVFGTFGKDYPKLRNVVLRQYEDNKIILYTHSKSQKVEEILKDSRSSICWYSKKHSIQIQFYGRTQLIPPDEHKESIQNFRDYIGPKPGTIYKENIDETIQFCVLQFEIEKAIALKISSDGHIKYEKNFSSNDLLRVNP